VGDHFKCRAYVSGFTGSAGTLVVFPDWAGLWTDGRYFLQAARQLEGSGIELCKSGEPGVPEIKTYLREHLKAGQALGFDGRTVSARQFQTLKKELEQGGVTLKTSLDLVGDIWPQRPPLSAEPVWELSLEYCGKSRKEKLADVGKAMAKKGADTLIISSLDDIAWLLNLRGNDIAYCPVFLAYLCMDGDGATLFANEAIFPTEVKEALEADGVKIAPYDGVYAAARGLTGTVWLDEDKTNCALWRAAAEQAKLLPAPNPTELPKATKNEVEVKNERVAHLYDGVALTKFMYWLRRNVGREKITELSAAEKLLELRAQEPHFLGESFEAIMAYADHGAIVHYAATAETDAELKPEGFLLCDTGGHYLEGTTDVTRTFVLGDITAEMRENYTLVLRSHLALLHAQFLHGCRGSTLDALARQPLWARGLDYNHGTGHGVGYLLCVHEGPNSFRFRSAGKDAVLEPGMILSDEPGLYLAGKYGIRLENLLVCEERFTNEYGRFLGFAPLTMVPFEREAIDPALLSAEEKTWLNEYHAAVYAALQAHMSEEERNWLAEMTKEL
jgi:Xaa-Pro aminopeptidase